MPLWCSICLQCGRPGFNPWVGKISWRRKWQSTPVFLLGKSHGWKSLVGYSPWGHKELDTTEQLYFLSLLTTPKPLTVWITTNCGKFLKRWEYQTTLPACWETCMHVRKQQWEPDMEQWTGSKLGKEYMKAVYCHPAYLTYMQSRSCEIAWMNHKLESTLLGEISITSDIQVTPPLWQKLKRN